MSTPQANERAQPSGRLSKTSNHKELQLSTDSTLSPTGTNNCSNQETDSDSDGKQDIQDVSLKRSPTNQRLLSNLQNFNIDRSAYKHYGHQSLLNAQSLDKIISEAKVSTRPGDSGKLESPLKDLHEEPKNEKSAEWDASNKVVIDKSISQILGIPPQTIDKDSIWPYSAETLNEILRYKTEQEKTRQESIKNDFGVTAIELLKLARSLNISGKLIPFLFVSNTDIGDLKAKMNKLQSDPNDIIHKITKLANDHDVFDEESRDPYNLKRRYSDSKNLPSFSETTESNKSRSADVSPVRFPYKLPNLANSKIRGDYDRRDRVSPSSQTERPRLPSKGTSHLQQHLPQQPNQTAPVSGMYPMYYTPRHQEAGHLHAQQEHSSETSSTATTLLGSPYSQKYTLVMYQAPQNYQAVSGNSYVPQQRPYQYYMATSPSNVPPQPPHQYVMHPSGAPPAGLMPPMHPAPVQYHSPDVEHKRNHTSKSSLKDDDDLAANNHLHYKRHKTSSKSSSINFMITTPKNPPAKKYNNTNKDR